MEAAWNTKNRLANTEAQKSILDEQNKEDETLTGDEFESYIDNINMKENIKEKCPTKGKTNLYSKKSFEQ